MNEPKSEVICFRVRGKEYQKVRKAAKAAHVSVSDYITRIGASSLALAAEVTEVTDRIREGEEPDPFGALTRLQFRLSYSARLFLEVTKAREVFRPQPTNAVDPLAELAKAIEREEVEA